MYGCCSLCTSRLWWTTHSTLRQTRGCNNIPSFLQRTALIAHSFLWRLNLARPSHPGHSTILLRSESSSGKCAKRHTVAASNNRDYLTRSLYYCFFAPHIYGCYSLRISCLWEIAHSTKRQLRGCNTSQAIFRLRKLCFQHFESWGTIYSYFEISLKPAVVGCLTNAILLCRLEGKIIFRYFFDIASWNSYNIS